MSNTFFTSLYLPHPPFLLLWVSFFPPLKALGLTILSATHYASHPQYLSVRLSVCVYAPMCVFCSTCNCCSVYPPMVLSTSLGMRWHCTAGHCSGGGELCMTQGWCDQGLCYHSEPLGGNHALLCLSTLNTDWRKMGSFVMGCRNCVVQIYQCHAIDTYYYVTWIHKQKHSDLCF